MENETPVKPIGNPPKRHLRRTAVPVAAAVTEPVEVAQATEPVEVAQATEPAEATADADKAVATADHKHTETGAARLWWQNR